MKDPILVVLAAGMGSRYGGLKQMDSIGRNGEVLLDYSVYDAVKTGYEKIVFVIRHDIENDFRDTVISRLGSAVKWELAFQDPDTLIPPEIFQAAQKAGRTKPWGTGHALLCAADKIDAPFTVINADDFYGREAFAVMCKHLSGEGASHSIVPYRLGNTLSPMGTVTRGVCEVEDGYLISVDELTAIERKENCIFNTAHGGSVRELQDDMPVSMNFWGFMPDIFDKFKDYFGSYLKEFSADPEGKIKTECFIPKGVDQFIKRELIKVKVLSADSEWFGVTYKEDREAAIKKIDELTQAGVYPAPLWEKN